MTPKDEQVEIAKAAIDEVYNVPKQQTRHGVIERLAKLHEHILFLIDCAEYGE